MKLQGVGIDFIGLFCVLSFSSYPSHTVIEVTGGTYNSVEETFTYLVRSKFPLHLPAELTLHACPSRNQRNAAKRSLSSLRKLFLGSFASWPHIRGK